MDRDFRFLPLMGSEEDPRILHSCEHTPGELQLPGLSAQVRVTVHAVRGHRLGSLCRQHGAQVRITVQAAWAQVRVTVHAARGTG